MSLFFQLYIHRSGRTARASREGLSVVLVGPEELGSYKKIMKTLNAGTVPLACIAAPIHAFSARVKSYNRNFRLHACACI